MSLAQQQFQVNADVRVTIDALVFEYNHDARTQSPSLSTVRLFGLAVDGPDLATKKRSAPIQRLTPIRLSVVETPQQQQQLAGL